MGRRKHSRVAMDVEMGKRGHNACTEQKHHVFSVRQPEKGRKCSHGARNLGHRCMCAESFRTNDVVCPALSAPMLCTVVDRRHRAEEPSPSEGLEDRFVPLSNERVRPSPFPFAHRPLLPRRGRIHRISNRTSSSSSRALSLSSSFSDPPRLHRLLSSTFPSSLVCVPTKRPRLETIQRTVRPFPTVFSSLSMPIDRFRKFDAFPR